MSCPKCNSHNIEAISKQITFVCKSCDKTFSRDEDYKRHHDKRFEVIKILLASEGFVKYGLPWVESEFEQILGRLL